MGTLIMGTSYLDQMKKHFEGHGRTKEYTAHQSKVHSVAWSCDGRRLASGSFDKTVCIFTLERDRMVSVFVLFVAGKLFRSH